MVLSSYFTIPVCFLWFLCVSGISVAAIVLFGRRQPCTLCWVQASLVLCAQGAGVCSMCVFKDPGLRWYEIWFISTSHNFLLLWSSKRRDNWLAPLHLDHGWPRKLSVYGISKSHKEKLGRRSVLRSYLDFFLWVPTLSGRTVGQAGSLHFSFDLKAMLASTTVPGIGAPAVLLSD